MLNIATVATFNTQNVATVAMFNTQNVATPKTYELLFRLTSLFSLSPRPKVKLKIKQKCDKRQPQFGKFLPKC